MKVSNRIPPHLLRKCAQNWSTKLAEMKALGEVKDYTEPVINYDDSVVELNFLPIYPIHSIKVSWDVSKGVELTRIRRWGWPFSWVILVVYWIKRRLHDWKS